MEGSGGQGAAPTVRAFGRATYRPSLFGAVGAAMVLPKFGGVIGDDGCDDDDDDNIYALESDDEDAAKENRLPAAFVLGPRADSDTAPMQAQAEDKAETETQREADTHVMHAQEEHEEDHAIEMEIEAQSYPNSSPHRRATSREKEEAPSAPSRPALRRAITALACPETFEWSTKIWLQRLAEVLGCEAALLGPDKAFIKDALAEAFSAHADDVVSQTQTESQSQSQTLWDESQATQPQYQSQEAQPSQHSQHDDVFGDDDDDDDDDNDDAKPHATWLDTQG